jgi:FkbM family methyltransferase
MCAILYYVDPGDQVMDIGANVGAYTVWMSKFISRPGRIHAFEPDEASFKKLQSHIAVNNMGDLVKVNRCALSDSDGVLNFTTGLDRLNHITTQREENSVSVPSCTLDAYCEANAVGRVTYMKVDVEGFEYMVLKGAGKLFSSKGVDILQLEINDAVRYAGVSVEDLLALLKGYQYSLCRYDVDNNQLVPIEYHRERENYFAVADMAGVNSKLRT